MNNKVNMTIEVKNGKTYEVERIIEDRAEVYESLARDMVNKKICCCTYIKSIKRTQLYNGFEKITVTYDNDVRTTYTIESH
jgi:hypothetical protein